jgi:type I restriction enzyme M protein
MTANVFHNIVQIGTSLWDAADQLRANSNLTATEYSMPVLGVIFLRRAINR